MNDLARREPLADEDAVDVEARPSIAIDHRDMRPARNFYIGDEHGRTRVAGPLNHKDAVAADGEASGGVTGTKAQVAGVRRNSVKLAHLIDAPGGRLLRHCAQVGVRLEPDRHGKSSARIWRRRRRERA